jgi:hypothetical protein
MARLDYDEAEQSKLNAADQLEADAKRLREEANEARKQRDLKRPANERLIYAATSRCPCGYGFAYDPTGELTTDKSESPFRRPHQWECAGTLLHVAGELEDGLRQWVAKATHDHPLPFAFYELKSENQPSANGATTREPKLPSET